MITVTTQLTRITLGVHQSCCQLIATGVLKMEHWNKVWSETSSSEGLRKTETKRQNHMHS